MRKRTFTPSKKARFSTQLTPKDTRNRGNNPARSLAFSGYGFSDSLTTNLVYADSIVLTPSAGTPTPLYAYRLNSVYDPDFTGIGGQPYWYDQLTAVYSRYIVVGAKMSVTFAYDNETSAGVGPTIVGVQGAEASALSSTSAAVLRMTGNVTSDVLTTQSEPKTVVATYSPNQAYGGLLLDSVEAAYNANPARSWNAIIFASPQGTDVTRPINAIVTIEYRVKFSQQTQNAGS